MVLRNPKQIGSSDTATEPSKTSNKPGECRMYVTGPLLNNPVSSAFQMCLLNYASHLIYNYCCTIRQFGIAHPP